MSFLKYDIFHSYAATFDGAIDEMLPLLDARYTPLRVVVFATVFSNEQYAVERYRLMRIFEERYGDSAPLVTYVAQGPLSATYIMEVQMVDNGVTLNYKSINGYRYVTCDSGAALMLFTAGIVPVNLGMPIGAQAREVFRGLDAILKAENFAINDIVRQWNFIENITQIGVDGQPYQLFNDERSVFYSTADWSGGYPAATGIGTMGGGVMVEVDAGRMVAGGVVSLDNGLQVAAHAYSKQVLLGTQRLTTPKFERAKAINYGGGNVNIYISGTAAIRGEESLADVDIEGQTVSTIENIEYLISPENLEKHKICVQSCPQIKLFRVYLKLRRDFLKAKDVITKRYPNIAVMYVITDVCRDELLIEIEGIAQYE